MYLARIIGTVVCTTKDEGLEGLKLLMVQQVDLEMKPKAVFAVAADGVGAGIGELVLVVTGSSARIATRVKNRPLDATIVGIVDSVEVGGRTVFRK